MSNKITHVSKRGNKLDTYQKLFDNPKFQAFSIFLWEEPMTITEIAKRSGVSRATIYSFRKRVEPFRKTLKVKQDFTKEKRYYLDFDILTGFLTEKLQLTEDETDLLERFFSRPFADFILKKANKSWDEIFFKVGELFTSMLIAVDMGFLERVNMKKVNKLPSPILKQYFNEVMDFVGKEDRKLVKAFATKLTNSKFTIKMTMKDFYDMKLAVANITKGIGLKW